MQCKYLEAEADALDAAPFPGELGQEVLNSISAQAWAEWIELQTKIINEYQMDMSDPRHRKKLQEQMLVFLKLREGDGTQLLDVGNVPY